MKKQYIILLVLFIAITLIIGFSLYIARQTLEKNIRQEENKAVIRDPELPSPEIIIPPAARTDSVPDNPKKITHEEETELENIPDEFFSEDNKKVLKQISEEEKEETGGERRLNKKPSLNNLKDLKFKKVIIY